MALFCGFQALIKKRSLLQMKRGDFGRRVVSGVAMLLGIICLGLAVIATLRAWERGDHIYNILIVVMFAFTLVPTVFILQAGWSLWQEMSLVALGQTVGVFVLCGIIILGTLVDHAVPVWLILYLAVVLGIPFYLVLMRFLYRAVTGEWRASEDFIGRGLIGMLAYLIWSGLNLLADLWPDTGPSGDALKIFGSVFLAWVFYWLGCRFFVVRSG
jgi:O-antigen/teichoic acid export membrane protein